MLPQYLLKTKLLPPRLGKRVLPRPRLARQLRSYLDRPATIVSASAGCGKTTMVAELVHSAGFPFVWYQIDGADVDLAVFFLYLAHGLRRFLPDFGDAIIGLTRAVEDISSKADQLADIFINEVSERVEEKIIVVLDDFHHLDSSEAVNVAIDRLLQYLPDMLHIMITSRTMPNLSVTRLRSKGLVGLVDRQDLLFTQEEVERLFAEVFQRTLPSSLISEFYKNTEGWITGLQLIEQSIDRNGLGDRSRIESGELAAALQRSELDIFDYFAEEVLNAEPKENRLLLGQLSLLEEIDPVVCESVFSELAWSDQLRELARRNTFVTRAHSPGSEETYRLHPLFRSFLKRWLAAELGAEEMSKLHRRLGGYFESAGRWEVAADHYIEAEDEDDLAELIAEQGAELIRLGRFAVIKRALERLSQRAISSRPKTILVQADVALIEGEHSRALNLYIRAARIAGEASNPAVEAEALRGQAYIARYSGDSSRAIDLATAAIELAPESQALRARCHNLIGLCRFFAFQDTEQAIRSWRLALEEARRAADDRLVGIVLHNLGLPYSYEGDFNESLRWFSELIQHDSLSSGGKDEKTVPFPQEAIAHLNIARIKLVQGRFEETESHLEQAMDRCQVFHLVGYGAQTLETFGNLYRERGESRKALDFYEEAARAYGRAGQTDRELLDERAALYLRMGEIGRARADAEEYHRIWSSESPTHRVHALITLGRVQMQSGQSDKAEAALREAAAISRSNRLNYNAARALTSLARLLWGSGRSQEALGNLKDAVELSKRYDYSYWLASEAALSVDLFRTAISLAGEEWDHLRSAITIAAAHVTTEEVKSLHAQAAIQGPSFDLAINLLGPVEVYRSAEESPNEDAWRLAKSLHILCYLTSRRSHRASKDVLADLFWPGDDWESVAKNFHPTISHLRKALNHGQVVRKNFVVYKEGAYFLNPQYRYRIDTEEFEKLIVNSREARSEGDIERAAAMAARAVQLYRGDFLEELYYDWVAEFQGYYRDLNVEALNELASYHQDRGEPEAAIRYGQMILQRDPYREDVHCLVMEAYVRTGNRAAAIEQFAELRRMLRRELEVEPLPATIARYQALIK